jgi:hypothetical protein
MTVYRFKLDENVVDEVTAFAKLHQFDSKQDYKKAWEEWQQENDAMVDRETRRLNELGYDGDVVSKMYKAGRYYFRTKNLNEQKEAKKRRQYIGMEPEVLEAMDKHIEEMSKQEDYTPATGYDNFCKNHVNLLREEIIRITKTNPNVCAKLISAKFKKTYKNRYYIFSKTN